MWAVSRIMSGCVAIRSDWSGVRYCSGHARQRCPVNGSWTRYSTSRPSRSAGPAKRSDSLPRSTVRSRDRRSDGAVAAPERPGTMPRLLQQGPGSSRSLRFLWAAGRVSISDVDAGCPDFLNLEATRRGQSGAKKTSAAPIMSTGRHRFPGRADKSSRGIQQEQRKRQDGSVSTSAKRLW